MKRKMGNKISKTLGTLILGAGLNFNSYSQESAPTNLHLRDINGNYLGSMHIDLIMPLLMKYEPIPNGGIMFDYDDQSRLIEEKGFYYNEKLDTLKRIVTVNYEYINEERKIKKIILNNNANEKIDKENKRINYLPEL